MVWCCTTCAYMFRVATREVGVDFRCQEATAAVPWTWGQQNSPHSASQTSTWRTFPGFRCLRTTAGSTTFNSSILISLQCNIDRGHVTLETCMGRGGSDPRKISLDFVAQGPHGRNRAVPCSEAMVATLLLMLLSKAVRSFLITGRKLLRSSNFTSLSCLPSVKRYSPPEAPHTRPSAYLWSSVRHFHD